MDKEKIENLSLQYADGIESLRGISLGIVEKAIRSSSDPAGGGKSTLLRCLNRLNDLTEVKAVSGRILIDGQDILDSRVDVIALRRRVGMVFARPGVLPMSIRENLSYGLTLAGEKRRIKLDEAVERSLKLAAIWEEVHDRLDEPAIALSGGQQQRICLETAIRLARETKGVRDVQANLTLDQGTGRRIGPVKGLGAGMGVYLAPDTGPATRPRNGRLFFRSIGALFQRR